MKYKALKMLVIAKQYANTEKGEKTISCIINFIVTVLIVDIALLIVGTVL